MSMNTWRQHLINFVTASVMTIAWGQAASAKEPVKEQAKVAVKNNLPDVITQMGEAGYSNFVVLNKKNSKLYLIQDSDVFFEIPVLFGRKEKGTSLTPSGIFSLTNTFQGATEPRMVFHYDDRVAYLIHGVVPGREGAFKIDNVNARQLSAGCINVPDLALSYVLGFARQRAESNPNGLAVPFVVIDGQYSPKQFYQATQKFVPQKYNPNEPE